MSAVLILVLALSLDSLIAGFGLAPFLPNPRARYRLAVWFGLCDLLGTLAAAYEPVRIFLPPHAAALGLICAAIGLTVRPRLSHRAITFVLPILLGIDNLASPLPAGMPWLLPLTLFTSAALALVGMHLPALLAKILAPKLLVRHAVAYPLLAAFILILT